ncbi:MAG: hypothetical protein ACREN1_08100 [Candidatus Dormibacteria bacterium]
MYVDAAGRYLSHQDQAASFRCAECQAVAIDLAAAARARARDTGYAPEPVLSCPACGDQLLAPEERDDTSDLECPGCGAIFSWDEGSASVLGRFSTEPEGERPED